MKVALKFLVQSVSHREHSLIDTIRRYNLKIFEDYLAAVPDYKTIKLKHFLGIFQDIEKLIAPLIIGEVPEAYRVELPAEKK